jgi:hypothetical protein
MIGNEGKAPVMRRSVIVVVCAWIAFASAACNFFLPPADFSGPFPDPTPTAVPGAGVTPTANPTLQPDGNMIYNGDFTNGLTYWSYWVNTSEGTDAAISNAGGYLAVEIVDGVDTYWYIQVNQLYLTLNQNKKYTLTFDAWAEGARNIFIELSENGRDNNGDGNSYTSYDNESVSIGTTSAGYTVVLYMNDVTDVLARLVFNFGTNNNDVFIDNVKLVESDP